MNAATPSNYVLGRSASEYERLTLQARVLRPYTDKFFRHAGLASGMRVLDIGCGMGDVAMLAGDIVGPGGRVLGVDSDSAVLENARRRAREQGCSSWVSFEAADIDEFNAAEQFDALVGRYVLLYLPDAAATIRHLLTNVKPGGIVVFHDADFPDPHPSYPPCALWDQSCALIGEAFRRAGAPVNFGRKLGKTFLGAGLPFPEILAETTVAGGPGSHVYTWLANTVISVMPRLAGLGITLPSELNPIETLAARIEEEAVRLGSQVHVSTQFGAWARKPFARGV
jgi:ubiquinone/menaquinone biosynthesis C-methylase UbiE